VKPNPERMFTACKLVCPQTSRLQAYGRGGITVEMKVDPELLLINCKGVKEEAGNTKLYD